MRFNLLYRDLHKVLKASRWLNYPIHSMKHTLTSLLQSREYFILHNYEDAW